MQTPSTTPPTPQAAIKRQEAIERALMFLPRAIARHYFNLSVSEMEDTVGEEQDDPERNPTSGY